MQHLKRLHRHICWLTIVAIGWASWGIPITAAQEGSPGDLSKRPNPRYKHSDRLRPRPTVVTPPTESSQEAAGKPPGDATVLFDGTDLSKWALWMAKATNDLSKPPRWEVRDGYAEVAGGTIQTRDKFSNCHLHLEWQTLPEEAAMPERFDQHRGNSGIFIGDHPEIQVLDSYQNDTYPDGQAAAIYGSWPPLVNASRKPGEWQSYDIYYVAPEFKNGKKARSAAYTLLHNNLPVHLSVEVPGEEIECRVRLQAHGGKVRYRNIWVRPLHSYDENEGKPLPPGARTENPFQKKPAR